MSHQLAMSLLRSVAKRLPADFSGLGVVFYENLDELPFLALDGTPEEGVSLPVIGRTEIAVMLARVSSLRSSWHDGFHFVNTTDEKLTHLSQFVVPPLPVFPQKVPKLSGARLMTAYLTAEVPGIIGVGVLSGRSKAHYCSGGAAITSELLA